MACLTATDSPVKVSDMTNRIDVLEAEVLSLPQAERSRLVDRLLATLDHPPEWEAAWAAEADRREAQISSGRATWVPGDEALARVRAALK